MLPPKAFERTREGASLHCRVQPGASRSGIAGAYGEDAVKIALASPPVDGKANKELCAMLAKLCNVPKADVSVLSGETSRSKRVGIRGVTPEDLMKLLDN